MRSEERGIVLDKEERYGESGYFHESKDNNRTSGQEITLRGVARQVEVEQNSLKGVRGYGPALIGKAFPPPVVSPKVEIISNCRTWAGCEVLRGTMSNWNFESHNGMDKNNMALENGERFTKLDSDLTFIPSLADKKPEEKFLSKKPIPYFKLFRYATWYELVLTLLGILLGIATGCCLPIIIILYGEFTTLLVERHQENVTSSYATLLQGYGGGQAQMVNSTQDEKNSYLMNDSIAFGVICSSVGAAQFVLGTLTILSLNRAAQGQASISRVRRLFLMAVLKQDMAWCDTNSTATFASQLTEDLDKLQEGIGEKIGIFMYLMVSFVSSVIMSFIYGWKLTLVVLSCAPIIIAAQSVVAKVQSTLTVKELESYGEAGAVVEEVLSSIRTVVAFGGEEKEVERYTKMLGPAQVTGIKRGLFSGLGGGVMWFITYCSYAIAFWYGVELILDSRYIEPDSSQEKYTPAILIICLFGVLAGAMNMGLASPHLEAFAVARGAAASVFSIMDRASEIDSFSKAGHMLKAMQGDIEFNGVHFNYPARSEVKVLKDLNLSIKQGETVALVGSSGCGKSTVVQLVQRLYDPIRGVVSIDGIDVKQLNVSCLRSHIGVVGQEPVLFATTIAENIRYGREDATLHEIELAAKEANAHDFINKLPKGYNTLVGERGAQLSGGQKQRIAIARALVRKPTILLLDEATSALDMHSEAIVQAALDKARKGRTTIIVAHRLSTISGADRIVYLSEGKVVEQGTHQELMALKGNYWSQVNADSSSTQGPGEGIVKEQVGNTVINMDRRQSTHSLKKDTKDVDFNLEQEDETYDVPFTRIMSLNNPEWMFNIVGCLASLLVGCTLPGFAVLFGEVYRMYMFGKAGVRLTTRLRVATMRAMLKQEMGWFDEDRNRVGILCARLSGDASSVQGATGTRIGTILQAASTMVIGTILGLYYSWKLALVSLVTVPLVLGGIYGESKIIHSGGLHEKEALECATKAVLIDVEGHSLPTAAIGAVLMKLSLAPFQTHHYRLEELGIEHRTYKSIAVEAIANLRTVASLGAEHLFIRLYEEQLRVAKASSQMKTKIRGLVFALGTSAPFFAYALTLYYGGVLTITEGLPYENIINSSSGGGGGGGGSSSSSIVVSEALLFGAWMLGQSLAYVPSFNTAKLSAGRLLSLIDRKPRIQSTNENQTSISGDGRIQYSRVKFSYPTRPGVTILHGLDLMIEPGKTVALVGPSGCGKSTCIQMLLRFYDPMAGTIALNNFDVQEVSLRALRSEIGLVSQEPVLFDRTIADNIAYGDNKRTVPMEDIMEAAKKANIHSFISSLPLGYNTRLGSKGTQLSGGQKQRVAIARALVRNPRILLLDEATSALDTQSQKVVQDALDHAREGRTCITIAHRLTTVQQADIICVLSQGCVAEMGSHSELVEKGGLYLQLLNQAAAAYK
uniref:ABC-type xenobiotic transporter n=1 Tax=Timema douglasi TaxID=61478 RepID=A0A7R8VFN0_TIMDO|nr:unnamed protein product [Timema douglasi]